MSGDLWAVVWIAVVMKIPIAMLLYLVWYAVKEPPLAEADPGEGGGSDRDPRPHPRDRPPTPPRRGPHRECEPVSPERVRVSYSGAERRRRRVS
jgi:hypothetical protein